jgi:hypothetical protein
VRATSAEFGGAERQVLGWKCFPGVVAAIALASAAKAADPVLTEPGDAVPGHPGVTYLDLLRQEIPDLAANAANKDIEGHLTRPLRHAAGKTYQSDPPDPVVVSYVDDLRIHAGGKPYIVVMADLGQAEDSAQDTALLALYDDAPTPRLVDAVDVGVDKDTGLDDHDLLPLGPGDDAVLTYSEHFNSDQSYQGRLLLFVRDGRFQLIAHIFTLSDRFCGYDRDEVPVLTTRPDAGSPYRQVDLVITETLKHTDEDCSDDVVPEPYTRSFHASYRWDAGKGQWDADEAGLARLDKENEARF